jgi:hypothetical protein
VFKGSFGFSFFVYNPSRTAKRNKALWGHNFARDSWADGESMDSSRAFQLLAGTLSSFLHSSSFLMRRLRIVRNLRMHATIATFDSLPLDLRCT